ncbi:MAG: exodeoxyribonuclease VII small subunit [Oscillospiraceae bacterium]|nr:exodeoxyribonuclease VII small subunit [Oscillospiraceae bacterium]
MAEKKKSFEEAVTRINEILRALERGDTPLEDSIKLFEEGAKLAGHCETLLQKAEQRVTKLVKTQDNTVEEQPFDAID